jgi:hypothetical protein
MADRRWALARAGWRRFPHQARRRQGWPRAVILTLLALLILSGGLIGIAVTLLGGLLYLVARINHGIVRSQQRPVERYVSETERTQRELEQQLYLERRNADRWRQEAERLARQQGQGRSDG